VRRSSLRVQAIAAPERMAAKPAGGAVESDIRAKLKYLVGKVRRARVGAHAAACICTRGRMRLRHAD